MCSATVGVIQRGRRLCSWSFRPCVSRHCPSSGPRGSRCVARCVVGGLPSNSLINILELKNKRNAHNELQIMHQSSYFDHTKFKLFAERNSNNCTILSSNIQSMNISTLVPIPKNNKKSLNDSANYRAIALSSVVGKLMDNIIMSKYSDVFTTSDLQFGFKKKHSTTHCTFVANEVIHYYNRNGTSVNAVLLDASKAFDTVQYVKLFRLLLSRKLCPIVLRCLLNLYTNQQIRVRWCNFTTHPSGITNGVKQGGVLSPVLFTVYIDELLTRLGDLRVGCYVGNTFCGALSYADDILLLAPTRLGVRAMLSVCESFANEYHVIFNAEKSKLLVFPEPVDRRHFYFMGGEIEQITEYKHLGNYIGIAADTNNIQCTIGYFWAKINMLIREFNYVDFDVKYRLMKMFCMPLYGSPL